MTRLKESMRLRVEAMALSMEELPVTRLRRSSWWIEARLRSEIFLASRSDARSLVASSRRWVVWERSCCLVIGEEDGVVAGGDEGDGGVWRDWVETGLVIVDMSPPCGVGLVVLTFPWYRSNPKG